MKLGIKFFWPCKGVLCTTNTTVAHNTPLSNWVENWENRKKNLLAQWAEGWLSSWPLKDQKTFMLVTLHFLQEWKILDPAKRGGKWKSCMCEEWAFLHTQTLKNGLFLFLFTRLFNCFVSLDTWRNWAIKRTSNALAFAQWGKQPRGTEKR